MVALSQLLAHGGTGGAIVETALVVGIAAVFVAVWLRSRNAEDQDPREGDQ